MRNITEDQDPSEPPYTSNVDTAGTRGSDDRRSAVNPAENPAPRSPAPDRDALRVGEENLDRVKPY